MAAGAWNEYTQASLAIEEGKMNLLSDTFVLILCTTTYAPAVGTDSTYANVSADEVATGGGYTVGGIVLPSETLTVSGNVVTWNAGSISWASFTATFRYGVIIHRASTALASTDLLVAFSDLGGGASVTGGGGTLTVAESASGIIQFTHNP